MKTHELLGQLSSLQHMMAQLLESVPEADAYRSFHPQLPPLAWLLGRGTYVETYWIREVVAGDSDMTARVRPLFGDAAMPTADTVAALPPRDHLLNWALELQDENLTRLANPGLLPDHPLAAGGRLLPWIVQEYARLYEAMLAQLTERGLAAEYDYTVGTPLAAMAPSTDHFDVHQGHFRIGAKADDVTALDNEGPTQVVELHAFRIDRAPVGNGAWLAFMEAGGYRERTLWDDAGWAWAETHPQRPHHWRRDAAGRWYGVGLNGPFDLAPQDPVSGLSRYEAEAYANWVAGQGGALAGAVVQHEYQWEVARRAGAFEQVGSVWEWCANPFHAYTGYTAPDYAAAATGDFDAGHYALRGGCLHTQRVLRRSSYRGHAAPEQRFGVCGTRLVFPPSKMPWEK